MQKNKLMKETTQELINNLKLVIDGKRHVLYEKTTKLAFEYNMWRTGEGINNKLRNLKRRESPEDFNQRKEITSQILPRIINTIETTFVGKLRSNAIRNNITGDNKDIEKITKLKNLFYKYNSIDEILPSIFQNYQFGDPNGFIIVRFYGNNIDNYRPYPVPITSENVLMYNYINGELKYIIYKENNKYILQTNNVFISAEETKQLYTSIDVSEELDDFDNVINGKIYLKINNRNYDVTYSEVYPYNEVFAIQLGYLIDSNNLDLYLSPLDKLRQDINRIINICSEYDVNLLLHVFLQKYEYAQPCINVNCTNGKLADGSICPDCKGTGFELSHSSGIDIVKIPLPSNFADIIDLSKMSHYAQLPIEILKQQKEEILDCIKNIEISAIGSDLYSRKELAEAVTATQINNDNDRSNNPLYRFIEKYCQIYQFCIEKMADIIKVNNNVEVSYSIDKSLFQKSINEMLKEVRENAGIPNCFINSMYDNIAEVMYLNNPINLQKYYLEKRINKLFGYNSNVVIGMMVSYGNKNDIIIKSVYSSYIVEEMLLRDENILMKPIDIQDKLANVIVEEIKLIIGRTDTTIKFSEIE